MSKGVKEHISEAIAHRAPYLHKMYESQSKRNAAMNIARIADEMNRSALAKGGTSCKTHRRQKRRQRNKTKKITRN